MLTYLSFVSEKAAPVDQDTHSPGSSSTQPLPTPNVSYSKVLSESPAVSLSNSPCQSPMLREEDEHSETGESEGEDEDDVPGPQWAESEREVTEVDINDVDMNKVGCTFSVTHNAPGDFCYQLSCEGVLQLAPRQDPRPEGERVSSVKSLPLNQPSLTVFSGAEVQAAMGHFRGIPG